MAGASIETTLELWAAFVARPRTVHVEDTASTDPRWITLAPEITILLDKVRRGDDLTPHLSLAAWTEGYTPAASGQGPNVDRWADKDFLLNVMGFHHFHLNSTLEKRGFTTRSNNVLFAAVSRDRFDVIGIFDHSVFDDDDPLAMPAERERLWTLHHDWITRGLEPGSTVLLGDISTSGHKREVVGRAQSYARRIARTDPKLDDADFLKNELYGLAGIQPLQK